MRFQQPRTTSLETLDNQIMALETQCINLEGVQTNQMAVQSLQEGVDVQKAVSKEVDPEKVDKIMEDMQDVHQV